MTIKVMVIDDGNTIRKTTEASLTRAGVAGSDQHISKPFTGIGLISEIRKNVSKRVIH